MSEIRRGKEWENLVDGWMGWNDWLVRGVK